MLSLALFLRLLPSRSDYMAGTWEDRDDEKERNEGKDIPICPG